MNFVIELSLYKTLEVIKTLENFRLLTQQLNPHIFGMIINKGNIIIVATNRSWGWTPYIREH